jgi:superfamily II DNA or RNA helicase
MAKRRTLLSSIQAKFPAVLNIIKQNPNKKTLLFSESIKSIETLKQYLLQNQIQCDVYHSKQPKKHRDIILKAWEQGKFPALLSCTALEEGLDVKSAEVGIFLASGKSPRKVKQRIGRILRYMPGKIARIYVIWCKGTIERDILTAVQQAIWKVK